MPETIADFEAILDNATTMNGRSAHQFAIIGSDDYYLTDEAWNQISDPPRKNGYIWNTEIYEGEPSYDWNFGYKRILYANIVLEGLDKINPENEEVARWETVKGGAHFYRGSTFFYLAQLFARQYNSETSETDLGIPLRLEPDANLKIKRASLESTYVQIIEDLKIAVDLLPYSTKFKQQPGKQAAMAMLARVYLQMGNYEQAKGWADETLAVSQELIDYNTLDFNAAYPFPNGGQTNVEILFLDLTGTIVNEIDFNANETLYSSYQDNDLRKLAFWKESSTGTGYYRGSYTGKSSFFTGLAIDEVFLIRAECNTRLGKLTEAIDDINTLLSSRFKRDAYVPLDNNLHKDELLQVVLNERRKELVFRGLRWADLKRLNQDPDLATGISRNLKGTEYKLEPNDVRWVWPIPNDAVEIGGLQQNPR